MEQVTEFNQGKLLKDYNIKNIPGVCLCLTTLWMKRHHHFKSDTPKQRGEWLASKQAIGTAWGAQHKYVDEFSKFKISGDAKNVALATGVLEKFGGLKGSNNVSLKSISPDSKKSVLDANDFMKIKTSPSNTYYLIYTIYGDGKHGHVTCAYTGASGWIQGADLTYWDSNIGEFTMKQADMADFWAIVQRENKKHKMTKVMVQAVDVSGSKW